MATMRPRGPGNEDDSKRRGNSQTGIDLSSNGRGSGHMQSPSAKNREKRKDGFSGSVAKARVAVM